MTGVTITADRQVFDQALKAARGAGHSPEMLGLNAPGDATLLGRLDQVWERIETALRDGYQFGRELSKATVDKAVEEAENLMEEAGKRARKLQEELLHRLRAYVHAFITGTLALVPTTLAIGNQDYTIETFSVTQKVLLAGSVKANILEVYSLTANGELSIGVNYTLPR